MIPNPQSPRQTVDPVLPPDNSYATFSKYLVKNVYGPLEYTDRYGVNIFQNANYVNINRKHPLFQEEGLPQDIIQKGRDITKITALRALFKKTAIAMADGCEDPEWKQIFLHRAAVGLLKEDYVDATNHFS